MLHSQVLATRALFQRWCWEAWPLLILATISIAWIQSSNGSSVSNASEHAWYSYSNLSDYSLSQSNHGHGSYKSVHPSRISVLNLSRADLMFSHAMYSSSNSSNSGISFILLLFGTFVSMCLHFVDAAPARLCPGGCQKYCQGLGYADGDCSLFPWTHCVCYIQ